MKSIDSQGSKAGWEDDLLKDISFIKEKKRYPISKKTLTPATVSAVVWLLTARFAWLAFLGTQAKNKWVGWMMIGLAIALVVVIFNQYYRVLKFDVLATPHHLAKNRELLQRFLRSENLAFTQHSEAHEVFMIISRNLNANPKKDFREIMVFIADDKQILVNSHFSGSRFSIMPPSRNFKKMSKKLRTWLGTEADKDNTGIARINTF